MVKFGTVTLPLVHEVERVKRRIFDEKPIIGSEIASRRDAGGFGRDFAVRGIITGTKVEIQAKTDELEALADGTKRTLDLEDGTPTITCIALDPTFTETDRPNRREYEITFTEVTA